MQADNLLYSVYKRNTSRFLVVMHQTVIVSPQTAGNGAPFQFFKFKMCLCFAAVAAAAPRKSLGSSSANASSSSSSSSTPGQSWSRPHIQTLHDVTEAELFWFTAKGKYAGGNPVCPRPTPTWQKGIGDFFGGPPRKPEKENQKPQEVEDEEEAGGSGMSKASRKYVRRVDLF